MSIRILSNDEYSNLYNFGKINGRVLVQKILVGVFMKNIKHRIMVIYTIKINLNVVINI